MKNNIERIVRQINQAYYFIYTATILSTIIGYYLTMGKENTLSPQSDLSISLSSVIILYILISIPAALYFFHRNLKKWRETEDLFMKTKKYTNGAKTRLLVVGFGLVFSIIGHFILFAGTAEFKLIFCAGIAGIALIFCKPSASKVISELEIDEEE